MTEEDLGGLRQFGEEVIDSESVVKRSIEKDAGHRHVVIFVPGAINPAPDWIAEIIQEDRIEVSPIIPVSVAWDEAPSPMVVFFGIGESSYIRELSSKIDVILNKYDSNPIHIVAHSWGTYAIFKSMQLSEKFKFENIFLLGSVVKSKLARKFSDRYSMIHCDMVEDDKVSRKLSNWLFFRYGNSSMYGIHDGQKSTNIRFNGGHADLTSIDHYLFKIRPRIMGEKFNSHAVSIKINLYHIWHWATRYLIVSIYFSIFPFFAFVLCKFVQNFLLRAS